LPTPKRLQRRIQLGNNLAAHSCVGASTP
jgi:hypothetical protein